MQKNEDVGIIRQQSIDYSNLIVQSFIKDITEHALKEVKEQGRVKIKAEDILATIKKHEHFDFIELDRQD